MIEDYEGLPKERMRELRIDRLTQHYTVRDSLDIARGCYPYGDDFLMHTHGMDI